jgi:hypothetical protein
MGCVGEALWREAEMCMCDELDLGGVRREVRCDVICFVFFCFRFLVFSGTFPINEILLLNEYLYQESK